MFITRRIFTFKADGSPAADPFPALLGEVPLPFSSTIDAGFLGVWWSLFGVLVSEAELGSEGREEVLVIRLAE